MSTTESGGRKARPYRRLAELFRRGGVYPRPRKTHKKILHLQSPEGMVEVFFGNMTDKQQVERLTAQTVEQPLTVTGMLSASPGRGKDPLRLQITAEAIDF